MDDNPLLVSVNDLTDSITSLPSIGERRLNQEEEREKIILEVHNHLGNVRQMVESSIDSFNGTEQFIILKSAQKELHELGARLFEAHQVDLLSDEYYKSIAKKIRKLQDLISDTIDPEYV